MEQYYRILGLEKGASKEAIKKAYKEKARLYHPDVSTLPDAHNKFIEITEAYEYLMLGYKPLRIPKDPYARFRYQKKPPTDPEEFKLWQQFVLEKIRQKARMQAQKNYEEFVEECEAFKKSKFFIPGVVLLFLAGVVYVLTAAFLIALPFITAFLHHKYAYAIAMFPLIIMGFVMFFHGFREYEFWSHYFR